LLFSRFVRRYEPRKFLQRTFNFGMLGQQNETFIYSDEWENFNGGFGKAFLKTKRECERSERERRGAVGAPPASCEILGNDATSSPSSPLPRCEAKHKMIDS
jgi:hypothetical protein